MYKVQLLAYYGEQSLKNPEVVTTTDPLDCLHDAHEFVHWFACQLSTSFAYRIIEFCEQGDFRYVNAYPINVQSPIDCIYCPPRPLYLHIKKKRVVDRHREGLFYEYPDNPRGIYRNTSLQCPRF